MPASPPLLDTEHQPYLGLAEITDVFEVQPGTTWRWQQRGVLPAPDFLVSKNVPAWSRDRIVAWGKQTGRLGPDGRPAGKQLEQQPTG